MVARIRARPSRGTLRTLPQVRSAAAGSPAISSIWPASIATQPSRVCPGPGEDGLGAADGRAGVGEPAGEAVKQRERREDRCLGPWVAGGRFQQSLGAAGRRVGRDRQIEVGCQPGLAPAPRGGCRFAARRRRRAEGLARQPRRHHNPQTQLPATTHASAGPSRSPSDSSTAAAASHACECIGQGPALDLDLRLQDPIRAWPRTGPPRRRPAALGQGGLRPVLGRRPRTAPPRAAGAGRRAAADRLGPPRARALASRAPPGAVRGPARSRPAHRASRGPAGLPPKA